MLFVPNVIGIERVQQIVTKEKNTHTNIIPTTKTAVSNRFRMRIKRLLANGSMSMEQIYTHSKFTSSHIHSCICNMIGAIFPSENWRFLFFFFGLIRHLPIVSKLLLRQSPASFKIYSTNAKNELK